MSTASHQRTRVLVALMLAMALVAMDTTIVATAIPQVVGDLGGFSEIGWVFSVYLLAQTVTIPVYGKLADLYGRKPILLGGIVVFLIGSASCAMSWNMASLVAFRALQGLGAGSIGSTVNTVAGDLYDVRERGRIQGWLSSVWGVSAVVAPAVGGGFAQYASWRWIFLVNLPIGAVGLALLARDLHERVERAPHRVDYAGALLLLVAAGGLVLGVLEGGTSWPWLSVPGVSIFAASAAAAALLLAVERRAAEPMMPPWLWSQRLMAGSFAATIVAGLLVIGLSTFLPTYAQIVLGLDAVQAGLVLGTMSVAWPVASALSARLYLRIGFRDTALVGAGLAIAAGLVLVTLAPTGPIWRVVLGCASMGAGLGLITTSLIVGLQSTVGWSQRGVVTGGVMFSRFFGQGLGAAVFGALTNAVLMRWLRDVPGPLAGRVPDRIDGISGALSAPHADPLVIAYLRDMLEASTHAVFVGLLVAASLTAVLLVTLVPRRFPAHRESAASWRPAAGA